MNTCSLEIMNQPEDNHNPNPKGTLPHFTDRIPNVNGMMDTNKPSQKNIRMWRTRCVRCGDSGIGSGCGGKFRLNPLPLVTSTPGILGNRNAKIKPDRKYRDEEIIVIKSPHFTFNLFRVSSTLSIPREISSLEIV
jgi:hypothetical protein